MKVDSIIFDLDGTLWDSIEEVCYAWNKALHRHVDKVLSYDDVKGVMGLQIPEITNRFLSTESPRRQQEIIKECMETENQYLSEHGATLMNNLIETLEILKPKYQLFIVSNCGDGYIQAFLKAHKLEKYFDGFICAEHTKLSKGDNIKLVVEKNNLEKAVYVGDTDGDLKAAEYANVPFIYAKYGFGELPNDSYKYSIDDLSELEKVVEQL